MRMTGRYPDVTFPAMSCSGCQFCQLLGWRGAHTLPCSLSPGLGVCGRCESTKPSDTAVVVPAFRCLMPSLGNVFLHDK